MLKRIEWSCMPRKDPRRYQRNLSFRLPLLTHPPSHIGQNHHHIPIRQNPSFQMIRSTYLRHPLPAVNNKPGEFLRWSGSKNCIAACFTCCKTCTYAGLTWLSIKHPFMQSIEVHRLSIGYPGVLVAASCWRIKPNSSPVRNRIACVFRLLWMRFHEAMRLTRGKLPCLPP